MGDILHYRIPNKGQVVKSGQFIQVDLSQVKQGFIVTSFDKSQCYVFHEDEKMESAQTDSPQRPVCYSQQEYLEKGKQFLSTLIERNLSKAIFSRIKKNESLRGVEDVYNDLCNRYPKAFVYYISSELFGTWIGATPESLLSVSEGMGSTVALAGTLAINSTKKWSSKEIDEQHFVTEYISSKLSELPVTNIIKKGPYDVEAGPLLHLRTDFTFDIGYCSTYEVVNALHPTPAVNGLPFNDAAQLIREIESHNRSLYTGVIGIVGEETNVYVNLRCAQVVGNEWFLYLGGGYTQFSSVSDEWQETENKSRTLLDIIQNC